MKKTIIGFGSYVVITIGFLLSLTLFAAAIFVFIYYYNQANTLKTLLISSGISIFGFLVGFAAFSIFEAMREIIEIEKHQKNLENNHESK